MCLNEHTQYSEKKRSGATSKKIKKDKAYLPYF